MDSCSKRPHKAEDISKKMTKKISTKKAKEKDVSNTKWYTELEGLFSVVRKNKTDIRFSLKSDGTLLSIVLATRLRHTLF